MPTDADISQDGLSAHQVELWLMNPARVTLPWLDRHGALLAPDERQRAKSFGSPGLRLEYVCARLVPRLVLSRLTGVDPATWRFAPAPGGKPEIAEPARYRHLRFNLSHTPGLLALAVCRDAEVGVDVEALNPATDVLAVASRFFAPSETQALTRLDDEHRAVRFFELWTLKEAWLKATGTGLAGSLAAARFDFDDDASFTAVLELEQDGGRGRWRFASLRPTPEHVLAVALFSPVSVTDPPSRLVVGQRWFAP